MEEREEVVTQQGYKTVYGTSALVNTSSCTDMLLGLASKEVHGKTPHLQVFRRVEGMLDRLNALQQKNPNRPKPIVTFVGVKLDGLSTSSDT